MTTLFDCSAKALHSLTAPGMVSILIWSVIITILALVLFVIGASSFFAWFFASQPALAWLAAIGSGLIAWFLFPGIMPVIVNFFDTTIAARIEAKDYPNLPRASDPAMLPELFHDAKFTLTAIGLNLLVLPLYLVPGINLVLFYLLNGYLLGREFFVAMARRHMPIAEAIQLRKDHSRIITLGGIGLAFLATIPIVNLVAPFWGVALMTHLFHALKPEPKFKMLIEG